MRAVLQVKPLPIYHPRPQYLEGPQTFLIRAAEGNGVSPLRLARSGFTFAEAAAQSHTSDTTADVAARAYAERVCTLRGARPGAWTAALARVCPQCCITAGVHHTLGWELRFADACVRHGCWLVDRCTCGATITHTRRRLTHCDLCGISYADCATSLAPPSVIRLSGALIDAALCGKEEANVVDPLQLDLGDLQTVVIILGVHGSGVEWSLARSLAHFDDLSRSWQITSTAAEALDDWPSGFHRLLSSMKARRDRLRPDQLQSMFGDLYRQVTARLQSRQFDFIRIALADFIASHWKGTWRPSRLLALFDTKRIAWVPVAHAARETSIPVPLIEMMTTTGELVAETRATQSGRKRLYIERQSLEAVKRRGMPTYFCDTRAASRMLGLSRRRITGLVNHLLPSGALWFGGKLLLRTAEVRELALLSNQAEPLLKLPPACQTFGHALKYRRLSASDVHALIDHFKRHAEAGTLRFLAPDPRPSGWLIFDGELAEVLRCVPDPQRPIESTHSIANAAVLLRLKEEVAYQLVRAGLLRTIADSGARWSGRRVPESALAEFRAQYVAARDIASELNTSPRAVADMLQRLECHPAIGPANGCRQVFYLRAQFTPARQRLVGREAARGQSRRQSRTLAQLVLTWDHQPATQRKGSSICQ